MNKEMRFSITATLYASKETVWRVLLSADTYQKIWGAELLATWETGTSVEFSGVWENVKYTDKGVVMINKKNRLLQYSYWSSFWDVADTPEAYCFISYSINPLDSYSCELTIVQEGFRDERHYSQTVEVWKSALATIKIESEQLDRREFNGIQR